ncbi:MAG: hypothetical protein M1490_02285 [Candidatus Bathyarchaeota archaeon]|nr:hypothetical protein [Candidatus Bathyarchaeota archaeon]
MRNSIEKIEWGKVEEIGKGTKANYDSAKKVLTFCFNRGPQTSSELLRASRELLMKELNELGYASRMKYNGEVVVENVQENDVVLVKKNHKLIIRLNKKQAEEKLRSPSESSTSRVESQSKIKFS